MLRIIPVFLVLVPAIAFAAASNPDAFAWQPHPGVTVPLGQAFTDETGRNVTLREFSGEPVVLALGYFHCSTLCGVVRGDLVAALNDSRLVGGRDYRLVVLSIDPAETAKDAAAAKAGDLAQSSGLDGRDWHYLVGDAASVARSVGFPYRYDEQLQQFAHPAGLVVLTASGTVSSYLEGVGYSGKSLRSAVEQAAAGHVADAPSPVLLLCFRYDAATGRYTLAIERLLQLLAGATILGIAGLLIVLHRRRRAQRVT